MEKSEFSETQFVIAYTRELFKNILGYFTIVAPSTKLEKEWVSDLIIKNFGKKFRYRYSEFYQFKRSKYYNKKVFDNSKGEIIVDTDKTPMYGFNIYNTRKTRQFNVLQKIASQPRCKVYYCAPIFYTLEDFDIYFFNSRIQHNSKLFDLSTNFFQNLTVPCNSNHKIIFDSGNNYYCSDPVKIEGILASERFTFEYTPKENEDSISFFEELVAAIFNIIKIEESEKDRPSVLESTKINFFEVRELLIRLYNIHWFPIFEK